MSPLEKAARVFDSCQTPEQLDVAHAFAKLAYRRAGQAETRHWLVILGYAMRYAEVRVDRAQKVRIGTAKATWSPLYERGGYHFWWSTDAGTQMLYQCTKGPRVPLTVAGYYDLDVLMRLKGVK